MTRTPVISLQGLRKTYEAFELGPIDLDIQPGYVVAIVGPNGGGKSTLMGMLMNLIQPTSGEITLFGGAYPEDEVAIKRRIGYAPERSVGYKDLSPMDLSEFVSRFYPRWNQRLYEDLLADVVIEPDKLFGEFSTGTQRRLTFALALATGSELLLLDEPTAGVDPFARRQILEGISRFMMDERYGDRTVMFATHVMEEVRRIADYVAFLVDGKLLGLFEKDVLLEGWRNFWLDREPEGDVPGQVELESGNPCGSLARVVSDSPRETEEALCARNIRIVRSGALDLEEILSHLMRRGKARHIKSSRAGE
jgi:ABC-2 type transport system ATP-binding protein